MKIALASPPFPKSISDGLHWLNRFTEEAALKGAELICFPESFLPGYPLLEFNVEKASTEELGEALEGVRATAVKYRIGIIVPMDWYDAEGFLNVAFVISDAGEVLGYQAKTQLDPSEDGYWDPGNKRRIFTLNGITFGIVICHEGFRYPELVRWAALNGAQIVFHPHCAGSNTRGKLLTEWGSIQNPYYEKAMMMRALENTIYFGSSNYAFDFPESASSLIAPDGSCIAYQPYGEPGVLIAEVDEKLATGLLAKRFRPGALSPF